MSTEWKLLDDDDHRNPSNVGLWNTKKSNGFDEGAFAGTNVHPRGIALDSTVVLMFHPIFMTQVDKSYHVQCNYLEVEKEVSRKLDVR
ncbi:hypothetical protein COOONC_16319 [Cooperia oncophora]